MPLPASLLMNPDLPQFTAAEHRGRFGWLDVVILAGLFGLFWSVLHFGGGMLVQFDEKAMAPLETGVWSIPYYAGRTLLRMWIAFGCSLIFTFTVGYAAAKSRVARAFILPAIDVLQSVPVLGFLSATVTGFMALFPGSLLGVECASIFAIFTGQVWNMTFGFYHSMVTIPADLQEAATTFGLNRWQRFSTLEVPSSMHSLLWNSMMSFGGGWFFVAQSEAISVMNKSIKLPGLGSYMASAVERGDNTGAIWAVVAMLVVIVASDQFVWRPLIAWADKFKMELTEASQAPRSWVYDLLRGAYVFDWLAENLVHPVTERLRELTHKFTPEHSLKARRGPDLAQVAGVLLGGAFALWVGYHAVTGLISAIETVWHGVPLETLGKVAGLGLLTMLRVLAMTVLATLIWTPIGVWIGFKPGVARIAQPLAQIAASFPVNMTFPIVVGLFVAWRIPMNWGSILLIAMGTQWYLLFNVIAGAMAIPNDLKDVARTYGLRGWALWRTLILPAIFPFWVTGACTAAGGAWNASIVAEWATWGDTTLKADGLGAFIAEVTQRGDKPLIICSIVMMSLFVVATNQLLWRRLYALAERRFRLD
jgi:NitT/TauT family transport system permease protein